MGNDEEGTQVLLRNSERTTWRRCHQKWYWAYKLGLEPRNRGKALTFGSMCHEALAGWYIPGRERGTVPTETFASLYDAATETEGDFTQWDDDGERLDALELGMAMLEGYVDQYGTEDHWEVVAPEQTFEIDVLDARGRVVVIHVGTFDALVYNLRTKRFFLLEHKTAKSVEVVRINSGYGEQGLTYWWAADLKLHHEKILKANQHIDGVLYNFLRKGLPDERPMNEEGYRLNQNGSVSKRQPKPLFVRQVLQFGPAELANINRRMRAEAWEIARARQGKSPIYKNPTRDCSWDCGFKDVCEVHEMGGDWKSMLAVDFMKWNPYEFNELKEERTG